MFILESFFQSIHFLCCENDSKFAFVFASAAFEIANEMLYIYANS